MLWSTCLQVHATSGLVLCMNSIFEQDFELQIVPDVCICKGKCHFGHLEKKMANACNAKTLKPLLVGHTWLRQLCVSEGVGCGESGINETMGCVFQRGCVGRTGQHI